MPEQHAMPSDADQARHMIRALAALREASEHLEEAAAASEHPNLSVASALAHVAAARKTLRLHGLGPNATLTGRSAA